MTIRHLRIFIAVVECGTMREAANQLFISQPSISQAISELETHYGVKLFERLSQRLYLTEKGKQLFPHAKHAVDSFETIDSLMRNVGSYSKLRIGASVTVGTCILSDYITALEQRIPNIETTVMINNTSIIEEMVRNCQVDVAVIEGIVMAEDLIKIPLFDDELVIIAGKNHPLSEKKMIDIQELNHQSFISREIGSVDRNQFENFLKENQISIKRKWECSNTDAIKNAVINGQGLSIMSRLMIQNEIARGTLQIIKVQDLQLIRKIQLIYHKNKFLSSELKEFIAVCQETYNGNIV